MNTEIQPSLVSVRTRLSFTDYRRVLFFLTYKRPAIIFMNVFGILFIFYYVTIGMADWFTVFIALFLLYLPFAVHRGAKSLYKATKALHEEVEYEFTADSIAGKGETFSSTMQWQTLQKVIELKHFFLFFSGNQAMMIIPKNAFGSMDDINSVRNFAKRFFTNLK